MLEFSKRNLLWLLFTSLSTISTYSQDILWEKTLGGKQSEYLFDAVATPDYGFILAGSSISGKDGTKAEDGRGNYDYWLWKMNEKGGMEWQKSYGGEGFDYLQSIQITNEGGYILGGISDSNKSADKKEDTKGNFDFWIIKLDPKGNELWQRTIGSNGQEKLHSINKTADGGYIIGGTSSSDKSPLNEGGKEDKFGKKDPSKGNLDLWIIKLNANGEVVWQKTYGGQYADELKAITQTKDGGYIVGSYSNSPKSEDKSKDNFGEGDFWVLKLNHNGDIDWEKTIGGSQDDNLFALIPTKDGGYLAGGNSNSGADNSKNKANGKGTDFWVLKLDEAGTIEWQETYDYGKLDILTSIIENPDGTFMIGGYAQSETSGASRVASRASATDKEGINDYIGIKINSKGEKLWSKTVGSKGNEVLRKLFETRDGGYVLVGTSNGGASRDKSSAQGEHDFWVVKLKDIQKPEKEKLEFEAYPNPASSYTNVIINFEYKEGTITLYDLAGRVIRAEKINGEHTIPVALGNIPQGVYIVNIKTNNKEESIKIIKK
ncbi:T9SS type A sorting domain-containing protein [Flavobacterium sp. H122]|uniref:T9SS type A sorting domain-containing protein n=1 Tax=Flavobacterium sp. H122 TaxID=2529860 RepID=UPI0010AA1E96|nr:T9SS type A sorting domain-containing protein [Flavobacterium sp. H122]